VTQDLLEHLIFLLLKYNTYYIVYKYLTTLAPLATNDRFWQLKK